MKRVEQVKHSNTKARVWNNKDDSAFDALFFPTVSVSLSCNDAWFLSIPGLHYKPLSFYLLFLDDRPVSFLRFHFPFFKRQCFTTFLYLNFVIFICFPFVALKKKKKTIPALMYVCGFLFFFSSVTRNWFQHLVSTVWVTVWKRQTKKPCKYTPISIAYV